MVGHGGSSAGSYLADPTSPIPSHCASVVATSTLRVKGCAFQTLEVHLEEHFSCNFPLEWSTKAGFTVDIIVALLIFAEFQSELSI